MSQALYKCDLYPLFKNNESYLVVNRSEKIILFSLYSWMDTSQRISNSKCEIFLGLCRALSGSTNVTKRLDVIVYPGHIRRVTGHALAECATSIRFQLITARTWCVGSLTTPHCPRPSRIPPTVFVLQSLSQSSIQFRIPIHPSNVGLRLDDNIGRATGTLPGKQISASSFRYYLLKKRLIYPLQKHIAEKLFWVRVINYKSRKRIVQ